MGLIPADITPISQHAIFSGCGKFRYCLGRYWDSDLPHAIVCMANPSKAGSEENDHTIHRLRELLAALGFGGYDAVNWEPYIATDPKALHRWRESMLRDRPLDYIEIENMNLAMIEEMAQSAAARIVAWGALAPSPPLGGDVARMEHMKELPEPMRHSLRVLSTLSSGWTQPLYAFDLTESGSPKHPAARGTHRIVTETPLVKWISPITCV